MIGDYDKADILTDKAMDICDSEGAKFIYSNRDRMKSTLEKQRKDTERYRNTKPYQPKSEDDRAIIEQYHNERGIVFKTSPRVTHINQNDFAPINEYYGDIPEEYCSFWCSLALIAFVAGFLEHYSLPVDFLVYLLGRHTRLGLPGHGLYHLFAFTVVATAYPYGVAVAAFLNSSHKITLLGNITTYLSNVYCSAICRYCQGTLGLYYFPLLYCIN